MTDLPESSTDPSSPAAIHAADLLRYYSFELEGTTIAQQLADWLNRYPARWIVLAMVEALYQGRYKAISVEQILILWQRREQTLCHFNHEFERLVSGNLPHPFAESVPESTAPKAPSFLPKPTLSYRKMLLQLPSVKAVSRLERLTEIPSLKLVLPHSELSLLSSGERLEESEAEAAIAPPPSTPSPLTPASLNNGSEMNGAKIDRTKNGAVSYASLKTPSHPAKSSVDAEREFKEFKEGVVFALSSGLAAHSLKPKLRLLLSKLYQIDWLIFCTGISSIDQFIPATEPSEFHSKLKSVVQPDDD